MAKDEKSEKNINTKVGSRNTFEVRTSKEITSPKYIPDVRPSKQPDKKE